MAVVGVLKNLLNLVSAGNASCCLADFSIHPLFIGFFEVDRLDVVSLDVLVGREACDAFEVSSEETLTWEVELLAYRLDIILVSVELLFDGEGHVLVDDLRGCDSCEVEHDG